MNTTKTFIVVLVLVVAVALANSYGPMTLEQKVADADLIVVGTLTIGEAVQTNFATFVTRQVDGTILTNVDAITENLCRISISEVLWPPNSALTNEIVIRTIVPIWWTNYYGTSAVYFLQRTARITESVREQFHRELPLNRHDDIDAIIEKTRDRHPWSRAGNIFDDWREPGTNCPAIRMLINKTRKQIGEPSVGGDEKPTPQP